MHHCFNYFHLIKSKIIQSLAALALLLLFVIGNTPRQWMHDIFANHVDCKNGIADNGDIAHINQQSFHCQVSDFVVESPFTPGAAPVTFYRVFNYLQFISISYNYFLVDYQFHFDLRGPPVV